MKRDLTSRFSDLKSGAGPRCLLLFGDDLSVQDASRAIINLLIPEEQRALNLERFDGRVTPWEQVQAALITPPFLAGVKIVWLENAPYFTSRDQNNGLRDKVLQLWGDGKQEEASKFLVDLLVLEGWTQEQWEHLEPGAVRELAELLDADGEQEVDRLVAYCKSLDIDLRRPRQNQAHQLDELLEQGLPPWGFLLMTAAQVDRRIRLYKRLDELDAVIYLGLQRDRNGRVSGEDLGRFINLRLGQAGKTADPRARELLVQRSASDLRSLSQELDKLFLYCETSSAVRVQDVETIVTDYSEGWVFDVTRAINERNPRAALCHLARLISRGEHPLKLLAVIASEVRRLLAARQSLDGELRGRWRSGMSYRQFEQQVLPHSGPLHGHNSYSEYMCLLRAERLSMTALHRYMETIHQADFRLKSTGSNPRLIMERLILGMCFDEKNELVKGSPG